MTILETEGLALRRLVPEDLDALFALYSDPEVRRHFPEGTLTHGETKEELDWFLQGHPDHSQLGLWATIPLDHRRRPGESKSPISWGDRKSKRRNAPFHQP